MNEISLNIIHPKEIMLAKRIIILIFIPRCFRNNIRALKKLIASKGRGKGFLFLFPALIKSFLSKSTFSSSSSSSFSPGLLINLGTYLRAFAQRSALASISS